MVGGRPVRRPRTRWIDMVARDVENVAMELPKIELNRDKLCRPHAKLAVR
jgi:hypothetical protein